MTVDPACVRKRKFLHKHRAKDEAKRLSRNGNKVYVYECPTCKAFHLTGMEPAVARRMHR